MRAALLALALVSCGGYAYEASHAAASGAMSAVAERAPAVVASAAASAAQAVASEVPAVERKALAQGLRAERRALSQVAPVASAVVDDAKKQAEEVVQTTAATVTHEAGVVRNDVFEILAFGCAVVALVALALHWRPR